MKVSILAAVAILCCFGYGDTCTNNGGTGYVHLSFKEDEIGYEYHQFTIVGSTSEILPDSEKT